MALTETIDEGPTYSPGELLLHELRTPLTVVSGHVPLLMQWALSAPTLDAVVRTTLQRQLAALVAGAGRLAPPRSPGWNPARTGCPSILPSLAHKCLPSRTGSPHSYDRRRRNCSGRSAGPYTPRCSWFDRHCR